MVRYAALLVVVLAPILGIHSTASARTPEAVAIDVDATAAGEPLTPVWAYYGYDEVNYTTTPEGEELLRTLAEMHTTPVRVRSHFLFNTGDGTPALKWGSTNLYTQDANGNAVYDYTLIDQITDTIVRAGAFPLVEIGFMPQALSSQPDPYQNSETYLLDGGCFYPPTDYDAWGALVKAWATHVKERYPSSASSWQWELWNEPDIGYWQGTFEEFARLYDTTEAALHAVFPEASLGGPAVARADGPFLTQFLEHCTSGTNAVTGETGTRLDMVSFHAKGGVTLTDGRAQMDLGNQLRLHRTGFEAVLASGMFAKTPIVISEADPDGCAACPVTFSPYNAYRNSPAYGAYEVAMMKRSLDLAEELGVELRGVLTWAFTFPGSAYFAGYRALSTNGIHLPVLNAFKLLGSLTGDRLSATSSGALPLEDILEHGVRGQPDVDVLATADADRIQVLVWHYHDDVVAAPPAPIALRVALPPAFGASAMVTHTRVDDIHGNAFAVWEAQGSPEAASVTEAAELRGAMQPVVLSAERVARAADGAVNLSFELPRFGISLVTLTPSKESAPAVAAEGGGCSCRLVPPGRGGPPGLLALFFGALLILRRRIAAEVSARGQIRGLPVAFLLVAASACRVYDPSLLDSKDADAGNTVPSPGPTTTTSSPTASGGTESGAMATNETNAASSGSMNVGTTSGGGDGGDGGGDGGSAGSTGSTGSTGGGGGGSPTISSASGSTGGVDCDGDDCCLDNPDKTDPGQCGCDLPDTDRDADGTADCIDACPDDADKSEPGACGCGVPDEDTLEAAGCLGLAAGLSHRYSFDGEGAQALDSQGDADGELTGTTLSGSGELVLSSVDTEQYVTLPQGILSSLSSASIELWFTWEGGPMWTRLFDFGSTVEGVPGEPGTAQTSVLFTPNGSTEPGYPYASFSTGVSDDAVSCAASSVLTTGVEHHVVVSLDTDLEIFSLYIDGTLACAQGMSLELSELEDVNCWIGRSQFSDDTGPSARIEEFRIYAVALTTQQVALSFASGPEPPFL